MVDKSFAYRLSIGQRWVLTGLGLVVGLLSGYVFGFIYGTISPIYYSFVLFNPSHEELHPFLFWVCMLTGAKTGMAIGLLLPLNTNELGRSIQIAFIWISKLAGVTLLMGLSFGCFSVLFPHLYQQIFLSPEEQGITLFRFAFIEGSLFGWMIGIGILLIRFLRETQAVFRLREFIRHCNRREWLIRLKWGFAGLFLGIITSSVCLPLIFQFSDLYLLSTFHFYPNTFESTINQFYPSILCIGAFLGFVLGFVSFQKENDDMRLDKVIEHLSRHALFPILLLSVVCGLLTMATSVFFSVLPINLFLTQSVISWADIVKWTLVEGLVYGFYAGCLVYCLNLYLATQLTDDKRTNLL